MTVLMQINNLKKYYPIKMQGSFIKNEWLKAVDGVSFELYQGETLGIVGESGCGKSTTRKLLSFVEAPSEGEVLYKGKNVFTMNKAELKVYRRNLQVVFQDPYASLDPKWKVQHLISEPLDVHGIGDKKNRWEKVLKLMSLVGLREEHCNSYPHEFSGGQRQRICIARALALEPEIIVADEPVSALDVSIQAQVLNLFNDLKESLNLTYIFISHDLNVINHISDRVAVMYLGKLVEIAPTKALFANPCHPYTIALMKSIPLPDPTLRREMNILGGEVPSPINTPSGCAFHPRCEQASDICKTLRPNLEKVGEQHQVACHLARQIQALPYSNIS